MNVTVTTSNSITTNQSTHNINDLNFDHSSSTIQENSVTLRILRKVATGIPRIADILGGIVYDFSWEDECNIKCHAESSSISINDRSSIVNNNMTNAGVNFQTIAEIGLAAGLLSEFFIPYFSSALKVLLPFNDEFLEDFSYDHPSKNSEDLENHVCSEQSNESNLIPDGENLSIEKDYGLSFTNPESMFDNERLDYVITQMDISRMERTASRILDVQSIHQLPTIVYGNDRMFCPSNEVESSQDSDTQMEEDVPIIDDSFDHVTIGEDGKSSKVKISSPQVWSWMLVPLNPKEEDLSQMPKTFFQRSIPKSISICNSNQSCAMPKSGAIKVDSTFDYCIVCTEHFQEGEFLRVLPCHHCFHCGCINNRSWLFKTYALCGCPICKTSTAVPSPSSATNSVLEKRGQIEQEASSSYQSDGSVPSWAFARLGSLLSSAHQ